MTYWASKLLFFIQKWPTERPNSSCNHEPLPKRPVWPSVRVNRYPNAPFDPPSEWTATQTLRLTLRPSERRYVGVPTASVRTDRHTCIHLLTSKSAGELKASCFSTFTGGKDSRTAYICRKALKEKRLWAKTKKDRLDDYWDGLLCN